MSSHRQSQSIFILPAPWGTAALGMAAVVAAYQRSALLVAVRATTENHHYQFEVGGDGPDRRFYYGIRLDIPNALTEIDAEILRVQSCQ